MFGVNFVSETAQVELKSGRVSALAIGTVTRGGARLPSDSP